MPYCSQKEMPKAMANANANAGRAVKLMRVTRMRIARATRPVIIAIRRGSSHCWTEIAWNSTKEQQILSLRCWVPSHCCWPGLEPFGTMKCFTRGVVRRIEGLLHVQWSAGGTSCLRDGVSEVGWPDPITTGGEDSTESGKSDSWCLFPQTSGPH